MEKKKKFTPEQAMQYKEGAKQKMETTEPDGHQLHEAINLLTRVIREYPTDVEAYNIRAVAHFLAADYNSAFQDLDFALLNAPDNASLHIQRGTYNFILERNGEAHSDFNRAVELAPDDPSVYLNRALTASALGDLTQALTDLTNVLEKNERNPDVEIECVARVQRAEIYTRQNKRFEAFTDLTIALELDDEDIEIRKHHGIIANQLGAHRLAFYDFSGLPLREPTSENYLLRSTAAAGLGYETYAENDRYLSVLFQNPQLQKTVQDAISKLSTDNFKEAITLFDEAIALLHPEEVSELRLLKGTAYSKLQKYDEAIVDFDRALAANPLNVPALLYKAKAHEHRGNLAEVADIYEKISKSHVDRAEALMISGVIELDSGDPVIALAYLNTAIRLLEPRTPKRIHFFRALARAKTKDYAGALLDIDKAIEAEEDTGERLVNFSVRAVTHAIFGDYDAALQDMNTAITLCREIKANTDYRLHIYEQLYPIRCKIRADLGFEDATDTLPEQDYAEFYDRITDHLLMPDIERLEQVAAIHDLNIKIDTNRDEPSVDDYLTRGLAYVETDEYEAGIADLTRVIEAKPGCSAEAYLSRGQAYRQIHELEKAIEDFSMTIEIDPKGGYAYYERGRIRLECGDQEQGIKDLIKARGLLRDRKQELLKQLQDATDGSET